jgi:hypothetical protein
LIHELEIFLGFAAKLTADFDLFVLSRRWGRGGWQ